MHGGDASPPTMLSNHHSPDPHYGGRAHSLSRTVPKYGSPSSYNDPAMNPEFTPLTPVSRIQIGGGGAPDRPLDRPTLVRPTRTSLQHDSPVMQQQQIMQQQQHPAGKKEALNALLERY